MKILPDVNAETERAKNLSTWVKQQKPWLTVAFSVFLGLCFGVASTIVIYEKFVFTAKNDMITNIKDRESAAQKTINSLEEYKTKYYVEFKKTESLEIEKKQLEVEITDITAKHTHLLAQNWEERLNNERIARVTIEEKCAILTQRLTEAERKQPTTEAELKNQIIQLRERITEVSTERDSLQKSVETFKRLHEGYVDGSTVYPPVVVRIDNLREKQELLALKKTANLRRIQLLQKQLLDLMLPALIEEVSEAIKNKRITDQEVMKLPMQTAIKIVSYMKYVNLFCLHYSLYVYDENYAKLQDGIYEPMETFSKHLRTESKAVMDAEAIVDAVTCLDMKQKNFLDSISEIIVNDLVTPSNRTK